MSDFSIRSTPGNYNYFGPNVQIDSISVTVYWEEGGTEVKPYPILSSGNIAELIGGHRLNQIVNRFRITTQELVSTTIKTFRSSYIRTILSSEIISRPTLKTSSKINSLGFISSEIFSSSQLNMNLKNVTISSQEILGFSNVSPSYKFYALSLNSTEKINKPSLFTRASISNGNLFSQEILSALNVNTIAKSFIYSNNTLEIFATSQINRNLKVFSIVSSENVISSFKLTTTLNVSNKNISSQEFIGNLNLKTISSIKPYSINDIQNVSSSILFGISRFYCRSITDSEFFNIHRVYNRFYEDFNRNFNPFQGTFSAANTGTWAIATNRGLNDTRSLSRKTSSAQLSTRTYSYYSLLNPTPNQYQTIPINPTGSQNWFVYSGYVYMDAVSGQNVDNWIGLGIAMGQKGVDQRIGYYAIIDGDKKYSNTNSGKNLRVGDFRIVKSLVSGANILYNVEAFANINNNLTTNLPSGQLIYANAWYKITIFARYDSTNNTTTLHAWLSKHPDGDTISYLKFVDNSNPYTEGFVGVVSLNVSNSSVGSYWDNVTVIPPQTVGGRFEFDQALLKDLNLTIASQEIIPTAILIPGPTNLSMLNGSILSGEKFGSVKTNTSIKVVTLTSAESFLNQRVSPAYTPIKAYSISSAEIVKTSNIFNRGGIYPASLISLEKLSAINTLSPSNVNILTKSILTAEKSTLFKINQSIKNSGLLSSESLNNFVLKSSSRISPYSLHNLEILGSFKVIASYNLLPISLQSQEIFKNHSIGATVWPIYPASIEKLETVSYSIVKPEITNIKHISIVSSEIIKIPIISVRGLIEPYNINTSERIINVRLNLPQNINPKTLGSEEIFGRSINRVPILPYSLFSNEITLSEGLYFYNRWYDNFESLLWSDPQGTSTAWSLSSDYSISRGNSLKRNPNVLVSNPRPLLYGYANARESLLDVYNEDRYYLSGWILYPVASTSLGKAAIGFFSNQTAQDNPTSGVRGLAYYVIINPRINPNNSLDKHSFVISKAVFSNRTFYPLVGNVDLSLPNINFKIGVYYRITAEFRLVTNINTEGIEITAKLFEGSSGTPIYTLTVQDFGQNIVAPNTITYFCNPYFAGPYTLAAWSDATSGAHFDNITNIPPQFSYMNTLRSQEIFPRPTLNATGAINFSNKSISTLEKFANPSVRTLVKPYSQNTQEIIKNSNLNYGIVYINPNSLLSSQFVPVQSFRFPNVIYDVTIAGSETISNHVLTPGITNIKLVSIKSLEKVIAAHRIGTNINPNSILTSELTINNSVNNLNIIKPYNLTTNEFISILSTNAYLSLFVKSIISQEKFGAFKTNLLIYPFNIGSSEFIVNPNIQTISRIRPNSLTSQEIVILNNLAKNAYEVKPFAIDINEKIATHKLTTIAQINPWALTSQELFISLTDQTKLTQIINPYNLLLNERFGNNNVNASAKVNPISILRSEIFGSHTLNTKATINPWTILSLDNLINVNKDLKLTQIINPITLNSLETIGSLIAKYSTINITPNAIISTENISNHRINSYAFVYPYSNSIQEKFGISFIQPKQFIYPWNILSSEILGSNTFKTISNIYPYSLDKNEIVNNHNVKATLNLKPSSILSREVISTHTLIPGITFIYPKSIAEKEILNTHIVRITTGYIYLNSIVEIQKFGLHNLIPGLTLIYPFSLSSIEIFSQPNLSYTYNLSPYSIRTIETFGQHDLNTFAYIYPSEITTAEVFGFATYVDLIYKLIYPKGIESQEAVPIEYPKYILNKLDPSKFATSDPEVIPSVDYDSNNWIYLTLDGDNLFTWSLDDNFIFVIKKNNEIIEDGWLINPEFGYLILSIEFTAEDSIELSLYRSYYDGGHRIETQAWIYPWSILGSEIFKLPRLQGEKYPGFIHGWFEKLQEIESFINFRDEYENGAIASTIEILEYIDSDITNKID